MNCNHDLVKISGVNATYVTGIKAVVTQYRIHTCTECGKIVKQVALSSKPVLSAWGTRCIGALVNESELTIRETDILNNMQPSHSHSHATVLG